MGSLLREAELPRSIPAPRSHGETSTTSAPLYWARYGEPGSPPLLVLHGGPGAHHDYLLPQMLELADEYELVFYDQRGGGRSRSGAHRDPVTWETQVDDVAAVVSELGLDPPSIVGYSWGGLLALLYSVEGAMGRDYPPPERLVLIDPAPISRAHREAFESELARRQSSAPIQALRDELAASGLRERDMSAYRQRLFEIGVAGYFADPAAARDLTPFRVTGRVQQSIWDSLGDFDLEPRLNSVDSPALVVHGREDPIPLESSVAAARALGARLVILEKSGHVPYVEQADALFSAIRGFLKETGHDTGGA